MHCFHIFCRSAPCHHAAAFPAFPAFPAFQPKMMEHNADIGAVPVAEQKRPSQWGSMRITRNTLVEVFICLHMSSCPAIKLTSYWFDIKEEIRTSFAFFLSESNIAGEILISFNSFNFPSKPPLVRLESARLKWKPRITLPALTQMHFVTLSTGFIKWCEKDANDTQWWWRTKTW